MAGLKADQALLDALHHPLRRRLLRRFLESRVMLSPRELADLEGESLSLVSYHVRKLAEFKAVRIAAHRPVRGSLQHFYLPTRHVKDSQLVRMALGIREG
jgi:DNA-binding transcriptional ArsR family regulator